MSLALTPFSLEAISSLVGVAGSSPKLGETASARGSMIHVVFTASPDPGHERAPDSGNSSKEPGRDDAGTLPARVMAAVQLLHPLASDVRVDLGRRDIAVPEQELHDPKVGTVVQQMRRERVPNGMRRQLLVDARLLRVALDDMPEGLAGHSIAPPRRKEVVRLPLEQDLAAGAAEELAQPVLRLVSERDQPLAVALADDPEHALIQVQLAHLEIDELGDAHAGGVQHLEHRAIAVTE